MLWFLFILSVAQHSSVEIGFSNQEAFSLDIESEKIEVGFSDPISEPLELPGFIKGTIHANTEWVLMCSAEGDFVSNYGTSIPVERLSWRIEGGEWSAFEIGEIELMRGMPTSESGKAFSMDVRLDLKWKDGAGDFLTNIDFTLMKKEDEGG